MTSAPTDIPTSAVRMIVTPAERERRAAHLHRRLQLEHAYLTRALQELRRKELEPSIARTRALYFLARGAKAIAAHEHQVRAA